MIKLWHFDVIAAGRVLSSWTVMMMFVLPPDRKSGLITSRELEDLQAEHQLCKMK
jgi:hypothetical protein